MSAMNMDCAFVCIDFEMRMFGTLALNFFHDNTRFGHFSYLFLFTNEPNPKVNKIQ